MGDWQNLRAECCKLGQSCDITCFQKLGYKLWEWPKLGFFHVYLWKNASTHVRILAHSNSLCHSFLLIGVSECCIKTHSRNIWKSALVLGRNDLIPSSRSSQLWLAKAPHVVLIKRQIIMLLITAVSSQVNSGTLKLEAVRSYETSKSLTCNVQDPATLQPNDYLLLLNDN